MSLAPESPYSYRGFQCVKRSTAMDLHIFIIGTQRQEINAVDYGIMDSWAERRCSYLPSAT